MPVAIYEGLNRAEEAKLFIDINTNQRGVPAALLLDIKQLAEMETAKESMLRSLFDKLQADPHSAIHGKLSPARSAPNRISRVTFNRAVGVALNSQALRPLKFDDILKLVRSYLNAFDAELPEKSTLIKANYFEAIFEMFDEVVRSAMATRTDLKQGSLQETIRPITSLDFSGRGKLTKKTYIELMHAAFRQSVAVSPEML